MKREFSHNLKHPMAKKDDAVTVVRDDGKEFLISRSMLAEHINRGFTVKDKADMPSEEELSKAVGYKSPEEREALARAREAKKVSGEAEEREKKEVEAEAAAENAAEGKPEQGPAEEATVPEERPRARKRAAKKAAPKKLATGQDKATRA